MTATLNTPRTAAQQRITPLEPTELDPSQFPSTNIDQIPRLAPQWQKLDLVEILTRPAAFISVSQSNCLYKPGGVLYHEGHAFRGSLEATIKVHDAARRLENFTSFNWVGYSLFRDEYPQTEFDAVQYTNWTGDIPATPEQIAWDIALVDELRERVQPGDKELYEQALQCAFTGTDLPITLARKKIEVLVIVGVHLDWCIEGNIRAARDHGLLPILIGDATGAAEPETERATFERINDYFAPVISSEKFLELVGERL